MQRIREENKFAQACEFELLDGKQKFKRVQERERLGCVHILGFWRLVLFQVRQPLILSLRTQGAVTFSLIFVRPNVFVVSFYGEFASLALPLLR